MAVLREQGGHFRFYAHFELAAKTGSRARPPAGRPGPDSWPWGFRDRGVLEAGVLLAPALADRPMIRLDNISKQNGHQILFIEASMGIQKGEKVGLVGPNGAGKTTL